MNVSRNSVPLVNPVLSESLSKLQQNKEQPLTIPVKRTANEKAILGTSASIASWFFIYPLDVVKHKIQNEQTKPTQTLKRHIRQPIPRIYKGGSIGLGTLAGSRFLFFGFTENIRKQLPEGLNEEAKDVTASVLGAAGKTLVMQIPDRLKVRMQTELTDTVTVRSAIKTIHEREGLKGLTTGYSAFLAKATIGSGTWYPLLKALNRHVPETDDAYLGKLRTFGNGWVAGIGTQLVIWPIDVYKTKKQSGGGLSTNLLQTIRNSGAKNYHGIGYQFMITGLASALYNTAYEVIDNQSFKYR